ncbi:MAG: hypothetical protein A2857_00350 [Candidatus Levybacteria bacterium RIFCSPHIGHO2_01_FULL_36_15]|nr:MAG: hypothetical protein A2857_00350 [Candidatus Levybacteria bacterium RIFCSPHIGHO2_01_FULL_36_15]
MNTLNSDGIFNTEENEQQTLYVFKSKSSIVEFVIIEEEMSQLNGFCCVITEGVEDRKVISDKYLFKEKSDPYNQAEELDIAIDDFFTWCNTADFLVPATCVVLIYFFVEKCLKFLNEDFAELLNPPTSSLKQMNGESKLQAYLRYMKSNFLNGLSISTEFWDYMEKANKIRNSYAHGDWDNIKFIISEINLSHLFLVITRVIDEIENQYLIVENKKVS